MNTSETPTLFHEFYLMVISWLRSGAGLFTEILGMFPEGTPIWAKLVTIIVSLWVLGALWSDITLFLRKFLIQLPIILIRNAFLLWRSPFGKSNWAKISDLKELKLLNKEGLFFGQWRGWFGLRRVDLLHQGEGHICTISLPGGGKTSAVVVPSLLTSTEGSFIITDPKGEVTAITRRHRENVSRVVYLNPFFKEFEQGTELEYPDTGLNPFDLITNDENTRAQCDNFARLLMVTDRKESGSYFQDDGAELLSLLIFWIVRYEVPENRNLVYLYELVRSDPNRTFHYMQHVEDPQINFEVERFAAMKKTAPAQWEGVKSKAVLATKRYVPATPLGNHVLKGKFDPKWLKQENVTVYILLPTKHIKTGAPWLNMVIGLLGESVGQVGKARPVTFILEEAPALGYLPDLTSFMRLFRASGLRMWIISQTASALAEPDLYGSNGAGELLSLCATKQFFNLGELKHAEHVSKLCGETSEINRTQDEWTGKISKSTVGVPLIRAEEIMNLQKGRQIIVRDGKPIRARLIPYFKRPKWQKITDANPYLEDGDLNIIERVKRKFS